MKEITFKKSDYIKVIAETSSYIDSLNDDKQYVLTIKEKKNKRSLNANNYCWYLCTELAKKLSDEKVKYTKEDVYKKAIQEVGIYKDFENLTQSNAKTLQTAWQMLGTGWVTEQVDYMPDGEHVIIRCYYGSSQYNSKQMSRLINNLVQDCIVNEIPTLEDMEIERLVKEWGVE